MIPAASSSSLIRVVNFDWDGTLIEHVPYLHDLLKVRLLLCARSVLQQLSDADIRLFLHNNQSRIGRGMFENEAAQACNRRLIGLLNLGDTPFARICIAPEFPQ